MPTRVRSFAKINLGLAIGPARADGFHALTTLYQTLGAHDVVTLSAERLRDGEPSRIVLRASDPRVPLDGRNTVWKMLAQALALSPFAEHPWSVEAEIDKRLPVQGGLGAGSANAAAALLALERETGLTLAAGERLRLGGAVGSDVPLFLLGGAVLGLGRGEQVYPMPDVAIGPEATADRFGREKPEPIEVVLALPNVGVSTPLAFREWDRMATEHALALPVAGGLAPEQSLTTTGFPDRLGELSRALAAAFCEPHYSSGVFQEDLAGHPLSALVRTGIRNDFEEVVFRQHPFLGTIKRAMLGPETPPGPSLVPRPELEMGPHVDLAGQRSVGLLGEAGLGSLEFRSRDRGALYAALSGSGSALFGLYAGDTEARAAEARLREMGVRTLRTSLLSRAEYWRQMFALD